MRRAQLFQTPMSYFHQRPVSSGTYYQPKIYCVSHVILSADFCHFKRPVVRIHLIKHIHFSNCNLAGYPLSCLQPG